MRGHLEKRGEDVWRAKVYLGRDADGRRRYVTRTIRGKQGFAEDQLNSMLVEAGRSDQVVTEGTLGDLVIKWREVGTLNLSPTTLAEYERLLAKRILPRFGKTKVRAIRAADVDAFYAELQRGRGGAKPLGTQSIQHIHAFNHLPKRRILPIQMRSLPQHQKEGSSEKIVGGFGLGQLSK